MRQNRNGKQLLHVSLCELVSHSKFANETRSAKLLQDVPRGREVRLRPTEINKTSRALLLKSHGLKCIIIRLPADEKNF